jgi:hypothetical protein
VPPFWWNQHKNQIIEQTLEKNQNWNHDKEKLPITSSILAGSKQASILKL